MTRARKELIAVEDTPFYHCISRCVRRAYLCGEDYQSGQHFDHRKGWLVERIKFLSSVFAIDVCAYAVMSNHYHLVLFINQDEVNSWSQEEVLERWGQLFPTSTHKLQTLLAAARSELVRKTYQEKIEEWRAQLADISWFMRCLNETVARMANKEDGCKGLFWEGRFRSTKAVNITTTSRGLRPALLFRSFLRILFNVSRKTSQSTNLFKPISGSISSNFLKRSSNSKKLGWYMAIFS